MVSSLTIPSRFGETLLSVHEIPVVHSFLSLKSLQKCHCLTEDYVDYSILNCKCSYPLAPCLPYLLLQNGLEGEYTGSRWAYSEHLPDPEDYFPLGKRYSREGLELDQLKLGPRARVLFAWPQV